MCKRTSVRLYVPSVLEDSVDGQNGTLAVAGGRDVAPAINKLLSMPFGLKVATRDWHPKNHVSFAATHDINVGAEVSIEDAAALSKPTSTQIPVWPVHCVQGTPGAALIAEINDGELDLVVDKGRDVQVEMFSGFADVFGHTGTHSASHDLVAELLKADVKSVVICGLAGDYCVRCTALDAKKYGFEVYVVDEAIRSTDPGPLGWGKTRSQLQEAGISVVSLHGFELLALFDQSPR